MPNASLGKENQHQIEIPFCDVSTAFYMVVNCFDSIELKSLNLNQNLHFVFVALNPELKLNTIESHSLINLLQTISHADSMEFICHVFIFNQLNRDCIFAAFKHTTRCF